VLSHAIGKDTKGKLSMAGYVLAVPLALLGMTGVAGTLLVAIACMWLIPDRRIERKLVNE
jgi:hypothetical protein